MKSGLRSLLGTGPFIGGGPLSVRGKDALLRPGSAFTLSLISSTDPVLRIINPVNGNKLGVVFPTTAQVGFGNSSDGGIAGIVSISSIWHFTVASTARLGFNSTTGINGISSYFMYGGAAAVIQMGANAAAPVHQALKAHNATGTDIAGANQIIAGGAGTGTGRGGDTILKTHESTTTGSTAQTAASVPRYQAVAKAFALTSGAAAATMCSFAVGSGKHIGVVVDATIGATGGTDVQSLTSRLIINAVNKSGTITATITQTDGTVCVSGGTLTPVTYSVVDAGAGALALKVTATTSLGTPTMACRFVVVSYSGDGIETITGTSLISPA